MSDLLCCFFCVFEVNSVKILLPLKFQGSELNLFAHANVLNFGLPIIYAADDDDDDDAPSHYWKSGAP